MAVAQLPMKPAAAPTSRRDTTPQEIINSARNAPAGALGALFASGLSGLLLWGAFTPLDFGPLAWIALIPLFALVRLERPVRRMSAAVYGGGLAFWLATLQWMRLGHSTMYIAWAALAVYLAIYFPLFVTLARIAVWRFKVPLVLAAPVVWVGLEFLRGYLLTGFSWYYLAHTQHRWLELIQISDLVGAYGVSFLVALVSGCAAELLPVSFLARLRILPASAGAAGIRTVSPTGRVVRVGACLAVFAAVLGYGFARRSGPEFQPGPRVALIQANVASEVKHEPRDWPRIQRRHEVLTGMAVKEQPDIIIWPETMFRYPLLDTPLDVSDAQLQAAHQGLPLERLRQLKVRESLARMAQMARAALVIGLETIAVDTDRVRTYNSAALVRPDGVVANRYDKLHRVMFGEYIPLVESFPWLRKLTPFGEGFGIDAGQSSAVFEHNGFRFAPIICFEDTVPQLVRGIVNVTTEKSSGTPKRVDFLVNLTNDGWFHGSSELDQHLITAAFRCVECRTPMVRAVNTGISAFIDGDGMVRARAAKEAETVIVETVPLDSRSSLYLAGGDWFAGLCLVACGFLCLAGCYQRCLSMLGLDFLRIS